MYYCVMSVFHHFDSLYHSESDVAMFSSYFNLEHVIRTDNIE